MAIFSDAINRLMDNGTIVSCSPNIRDENVNMGAKLSLFVHAETVCISKHRSVSVCLHAWWEDFSGLWVELWMHTVYLLHLNIHTNKHTRTPKNADSLHWQMSSRKTKGTMLKKDNNTLPLWQERLAVIWKSYQEMFHLQIMSKLRWYLEANPLFQELPTALIRKHQLLWWQSHILTVCLHFLTEWFLTFCFLVTL